MYIVHIQICMYMGLTLIEGWQLSFLLFYFCDEKPWLSQLLQKRAFTWGLTYCFRWSVTIVAENRQAHGTGAGGQSSTSWSAGRRPERETHPDRLLKLQSWLLFTYLLQQRHTYSSKDAHSNSSKTSSTEDQTFKHITLWVKFPLKPPQMNCCILHISNFVICSLDFLKCSWIHNDTLKDIYVILSKPSLFLPNGANILSLYLFDSEYCMPTYFLER